MSTFVQDIVLKERYAASKLLIDYYPITSHQLVNSQHETSAPPTNTVKHFDPRSHPSYRSEYKYHLNMSSIQHPSQPSLAIRLYTASA